MMREIKFRVWDMKADNPQERGSKGVMICDEWLKSHPKNLNYCLKNNGNELYLMQFTGLIDKNGKEIYEGDVVIAELYGMIEYDMESVIDFENGCFGIRAIHDEVLVNSKGKFKSFDSCDTEIKIEVIGNIHENHELS